MTFLKGSSCFTVFRPGKSFFFVNKEARPIAPVEIAQVIMQSASQATDDETSEYKPFIQSLTPSVRKSVSRTGALSALKQRRKSAGGKSVTGLFDSPTIRYVDVLGLVMGSTSRK